MTSRRLILRVAGLAVLTAACGSGATTPSTPPSDGAPTITITASGVSPNTVSVAIGGRVLFVNRDSVPHNVSSNPHPERDECPEINQVGFLEPGDSRETGNFVVAETCGFHDFDMAANTALQGTITVK